MRVFKNPSNFKPTVIPRIKVIINPIILTIISLVISPPPIFPVLKKVIKNPKRLMKIKEITPVNLSINVAEKAFSVLPISLLNL